MNVLIAIDSFKGSASSLEIGQAIKKSLEQIKKNEDQIMMTPISDGGEGSLEVIESQLGGRIRKVKTSDPLGKPLLVDYLITTIETVSTAIIESATIIGLNYILPEQNHGYQATTYGLGLVIEDALSQGVQEIIITMGGSATTDGGLGMLQALGVEIRDKAGEKLEMQCNPLIAGHTLVWGKVLEKFKTVKLRIASDVTNFYYGEQGAAAVFGKQKGLKDEQIKFLNNQMKRINQQFIKESNLDLQTFTGSGASGGLSGSLMCLGGQIESGFQLISQLIKLQQMVAMADVIITGEGSLDEQSSQGKVVAGICELAMANKVPVVAICGRREADLGSLSTQLLAAFSIQTGPIKMEEALEKKRTLAGVARTAEDIYHLLKFSL